MASVILADNGVSSGSAGLKSSADSSGVLALASGTGTTAVTVDASQNVGIGTTSPQGPLDVVRTASGIYVNSTGQGTSSLWMAGTSGSASLTQSGGELRFNTGGTANTAGTGVTERMRLDSAGNLGLGVTPSAWASGNFNVFQIGAGASLVGRATGQTSPLDELYLSANAYSDGSWKYIGTAAATQYYQDAGAHVWRYAASGTAGTAITFTQAMTLGASGNLGIGTSSPMRKLQLSSTSSCEQVISQSDAKTDGKNWDFLVDGGNGSTNANFTLRLLNDAGNATPLTGFLINGTTGQRYTPIGFGSTTYAASDCRVWIKFTGTGTIAIRASMNVSSIGDLGTGRYQVNFSQAMPNADYAYTFGGKPSADNIAGLKTDYNQTNTASVLYIQTGSAAATQDFTEVCAAVFL